MKAEVFNVNYNVLFQQGANPHTATATIDVSVADFNDLSPKFTRHFNALIPENTPIGTAILKITTTDGDIGPNAISEYRFIDQIDMFAINHSTGVVTLTGVLDRENKATQYLLKVTASDGSHRQETSITIDILDINDNAPTFIESSYSFGVADGQAAGSNVGTVSAIDVDGRGLNSDVWYRMKHPHSHFTVHETSGEVTTRQEMVYVGKECDLPSENVYDFHVIASDRGDPVLTSEVEVTVKVTPPNQNAPVFSATSYSVYVAENSPAQMSVGRVLARYVHILWCLNFIACFTVISMCVVQDYNILPLCDTLTIIRNLLRVRPIKVINILFY